MAARKIPTKAVRTETVVASGRPIEAVEDIERLTMDVQVVLAPEREQEDVVLRPAWAPHMGLLWLWLRKGLTEEWCKEDALELKGTYHLGVGALSRECWEWKPKAGPWVTFRATTGDAQCWAAAHEERAERLGRLVARPLPVGTDYQAPLATVYGLVRAERARAAPQSGGWHKTGEAEPERYWRAMVPGCAVKIPADTEDPEELALARATKKIVPVHEDERVYASGRFEFYRWVWEDAFVIMNEEAWVDFSDFVNKRIKAASKLEPEVPSGARGKRLEWKRVDDKPIYVPLDQEHHRVLPQLAGRLESVKGADGKERMAKVIYLPRSVIRLHYPVASARSTAPDGSPKYEETRCWTSKEQDWGIDDILGALAGVAKTHSESALQWYCLQSGDVLQVGTDFYFTLTPRLPRM